MTARRHVPLQAWETLYPTLVIAACTTADVQPGWYALAEDALRELSAIADADTQHALPPMRVLEIVQKYGTLRIDTNRTSAVMESVIARAERRSEVTCELCGQCGRLRDSGDWLMTLCDDCEKARSAR